MSDQTPPSFTPQMLGVIFSILVDQSTQQFQEGGIVYESSTEYLAVSYGSMFAAYMRLVIEELEDGKWKFGLKYATQQTSLLPLILHGDLWFRVVWQDDTGSIRSSVKHLELIQPDVIEVVEDVPGPNAMTVVDSTFYSSFSGSLTGNARYSIPTEFESFERNLAASDFGLKRTSIYKDQFRLIPLIVSEMYKDDTEELITKTISG